MVLDWFAVRIVSERPEAVQVDLITKACSHGVHQESGGRSFDLDMIGQPVSERKSMITNIRPSACFLTIMIYTVLYL